MLQVIDKMSIGTSLYDQAGADIVEEIMAMAKEKGVEITLPVDFVVSSKFGEDGEVKTATKAEGIPDGFMGLDCGPESIKVSWMSLGLALAAGTVKKSAAAVMCSRCAEHFCLCAVFLGRWSSASTYLHDVLCMCFCPCDLTAVLFPFCAQMNAEVIMSSKTIIWNGPMGVFEMEKFETGTKSMMDTIVSAQTMLT